MRRPPDDEGFSYFLGELRAGPVSYTHLDVYKRQVRGVWAWASRMYGSGEASDRHWLVGKP